MRMHETFLIRTYTYERELPRHPDFDRDGERERYGQLERIIAKACKLY